MRVLLHDRHAAPILQAVDPATRKRLKACLKALAEDPSGTKGTLDVKRLDTKVGQPMFRLRVGAWRIAFTVEKSALVVLRIFPRSDGYGWLKDMQ